MLTRKRIYIHEECQAATKGKLNVKYKGFTEKEQTEAYIKRHKNKRVSVTPEKGKNLMRQPPQRPRRLRKSKPKHG